MPRLWAHHQIAATHFRHRRPIVDGHQATAGRAGVAARRTRMLSQVRLATKLMVEVLLWLRCLLRTAAAAGRPIRAFIGRCAGRHGTLIRRIGVLLERLQFGQRNDVAVAGSMPDGGQRRHVVVVEALRVGVEQLPPLRRVGAFDVDALNECVNDE